ncbi:MAG: glycosyltransferase family 9 protein [Melioribacteraceae bacterium]|nr:glycosyltransferase family 9 protein [Melioribacteraceae bacterium]MCF8264635.1 glycosyltransferase family 9 protein [Melioribacteraceae bacterium]
MKKILIIQTAFLGDVILTLPLVQAVKEKYPHSEVHFLTLPSSSQISEASPFIDKVIVFDKKGKNSSLIATIRFGLDLKTEKYDLVISPHRSFRTALIVKMINSRESVGFDRASLSFIYSKRIKYRKDYHEVKRNLSLLSDPLLLKNWKIFPEIKTDKLSKEKFPFMFGEKQKIALAPGSVWATKRYPIEYWQNIAGELQKPEVQLILLGSEADSEICEAIHSKNEKIINLAGKTNLLETTAILKECDLLICNDSAPTHLAMAAGIKIITIYCSTVPDFGFYPYSDRSYTLSFDDLECKPCGIHGHEKCPINTFECGYKLKPETVLDKIKETLS